ncbi:AraC-like DNA-binding protein [Stackebrandtia albiflava]|uniref:AraC-like DNA-binding protein n=1 Tax=Stackebrandtia albiflava TaxID=406432 RepID=A0A562V124_9ACTN|nr:AraC family transcriptional regulator [Stackebrandtia albiflava]TWJ11545.1 AraC-like DNA-binding protein [Stackebrandtia albiflava]
MYVFRRPGTPALRPFVAALWWLTAPPRKGFDRVTPDGAAALYIDLAETGIRTYHPDGRVSESVTAAAVQGAGTRPVVIAPGELTRHVGVAFHPGGAYPFLPELPPADTLLPAAELWPGANALTDRLRHIDDPDRALDTLETFLTARLHRRPARALPQVMTALADGVPVPEVAARFGMTRKRFAAAFQAQVGVSPKRYGRLRRFRRVFDATVNVPGPDWARLAAVHGFHDQAHLIHEYRSFTGTTPGRYRPRSPREPNHSPFSTIPGGATAAS